MERQVHRSGCHLLVTIIDILVVAHCRVTIARVSRTPSTLVAYAFTVLPLR